MMKKKAQSAMEYLMTYGWAILIVIVVVAALYSMGVFGGGGGTVPCSPCFTAFAYTDHNASHVIITSGSRTIRDITSTGLNFSTEISPWTAVVGSLGNSTHTISAGTKIYVNGTITDGQIITINYVVHDSGMGKTDSATLHSV